MNIADTGREPLWYFAYGSNLDPRTFLGRRRMRPLEVEVGVVRGWALRFDLAVGPGERGVANVVPSAQSEVWGVAYALTPGAFDRLDKTEGVHRGAYERVAVQVAWPGGEAPLDAWTYHSRRGRAGRHPSRRYMGLLLAGARHHGLPDAWVRSLRAFRLAVDERDGGQLSLF